MRNAYMIGVLIALMFLVSGAFAYTGFNRYYYTDNYYPTTYMAYPYSTGYYPSYYASSYYYTPTYYAPTYYYPTYYPSYYAPSYGSYYNNMSIYSGSDGWGISIGRGSVCGYYGYC